MKREGKEGKGDSGGRVEEEELGGESHGERKESVVRGEN